MHKLWAMAENVALCALLWVSAVSEWSGSFISEYPAIFSDEVRHLGIDAPLSTFWTYILLWHLTELILNSASGQKYLWHTLNKTYYVFCTNICIIVPLAGADIISDTKCYASCKIHDMSLHKNECVPLKYRPFSHDNRLDFSSRNPNPSLLWLFEQTAVSVTGSLPTQECRC